MNADTTNASGERQGELAASQELYDAALWVVKLYGTDDPQGLIELKDAVKKLRAALPKARAIIQKRDWRVGIGVTPKMRSHEFFRHVGIIRKIHSATESTPEQIEVELFFVGKSERFTEPSNDWMTA